MEESRGMEITGWSGDTGRKAKGEHGRERERLGGRGRVRGLQVGMNVRVECEGGGRLREQDGGEAGALERGMKIEGEGGGRSGVKGRQVSDMEERIGKRRGVERKEGEYEGARGDGRGEKERRGRGGGEVGGEGGEGRAFYLHAHFGVALLEQRVYVSQDRAEERHHPTAEAALHHHCQGGASLLIPIGEEACGRRGDELRGRTRGSSDGRGWCEQ